MLSLKLTYIIDIHENVYISQLKKKNKIDTCISNFGI